MLNHFQRLRCLTYTLSLRVTGKLSWCVGSDPPVNDVCGVIMVTSLFNKNLPTKKLSLLCCFLCKYDFIYCLF